MRLGATLAQLSPGPAAPIAEQAKHYVAEGFESLWIPQAVGRGFMVPDPFVTLAVAAVATEGVELGTATLQVPLYHPADLAHRILSLVRVRRPAHPRRQPRVDRSRLPRLRPGLPRPLPDLRPEPGPPAVLLAGGRDDGADLAPAAMADGGPPLLLGSWGAKVERAAREFDGWMASAYRRTADEIIAAYERYRSAGGQRAVVCAIMLSGTDDLGPTGELLQRLADAGFDDAVVLLGPEGPDPEQAGPSYREALMAAATMPPEDLRRRAATAHG